MIRRPPRSTRTYTLFPYTTLFRSIRRDLTIMEEKGLLKRTHGGAIPASKVRTSPLPPEQRYNDGAPHQNAISKLAASFIQEKDTVYIGSRSEEHTSELQSLMRISYAVFCLKKQKKNNNKRQK